MPREYWEWTLLAILVALAFLMGRISAKREAEAQARTAWERELLESQAKALQAMHAAKDCLAGLIKQDAALALELEKLVEAFERHAEAEHEERQQITETLERLIRARVCGSGSGAPEEDSPAKG